MVSCYLFICLLVVCYFDLDCIFSFCALILSFVLRYLNLGMEIYLYWRGLIREETKPRSKSLGHYIPICHTEWTREYQSLLVPQPRRLRSPAAGHLGCSCNQTVQRKTLRKTNS